MTGTFDIASPDDQARVLRLADSLIAGGRTPEELGGDTHGGDVSIDLALAHKLARSRQEVLDLDWSGRLAIVFAMWGEQRRLRPRAADNPTGEDALNTKLDQLDWLFADTDVDWSVLPVDDGDPDDSAAVAIERAALHPSGDRVTVFRLGDAIPADAGPLVTLDHVDDSRKGGAIVLGAASALDDGADAIVMTDADNSVHLGQIGLLLRPFVHGDAGAVIGDRKHPDSVLVKAEARWGPGIVVLRHMQRMVGRALFDRGLRDTQAAFKLYGRPALESIIAAPSTFGFAFDSDWLYAAVNTGAPIERVPFAFIDSFEESASLAQGPMTTWESLLRGLVAAARARGADHDEEMADLVDEFGDAATLERVVTQVPAELEGVTDAALGQRSTMTPAALRDWLVPLKAT
ncbi:MAG: glycosyltransferase [Actinomycetota bacterium]